MPERTPDITEKAGALLAWYASMGVDAAVSAEAIDWLERPTAPPMRAGQLVQPTPTGPRTAQGSWQSGKVQSDQTTRPEPAAQLTRSLATPAEPSAAAAISEAAALAAKAKSLTELRTAIEGFDGCALKKTARSVCFMRGAETARLMVIGEAPGREEDRSGVPFVGRAGQLLDKMLGAIDHNEANTHITNIVYWRPPGNRAPSDVEAQICRPFLDAQVAFVDPDVILLMGGSAAKLVTGQSTGIMRLRGKSQTAMLGGRERTLMPTLHPAYLLRQPAEKRKAWQDLQAVQAILV